MAIIPQTFPTPSEAAVASYSYTDIAEGTGVTLFYGFSSRIEAAYDEHLTTQSTVYSHSDRIESAFVALGGGLSARIIYTKDFDLTAFNLPRAIKGEGLFNCSTYAESTNINALPYIIIRLKKNAVEITTAQSQTFTTGTNRQDLSCMPLTIPLTHFKKGDILRLTVELWADTSAGTAVDKFVIGHDPQNRDGTYITPSTEDVITKMLLWIPFRIDL